MGTDVDAPARSVPPLCQARHWPSSLVACALVTIGMLLLPAMAQAQAQEADDTLRVNRADVTQFPEVDLVITPPSERSNIGVDAAEVSVTELGRRRAVQLAALPGADLNVAIVIDVSTGGEALREVKGAAIELILNLPDGAQTLLLTSDGRPIGRTEATSDRNANLDALRNLQVGTGAPVADAIVPALERLTSPGASRYTVALVSAEPVAELDERTMAAAFTTLSDERAALYIVAPEGEGDDDTVVALAGATGGRALLASGPDALIGAVDRLVGELASQYRLSFTSAAIRPVPVTIELAQAPGTVTSPTSMTVDLGRPVPNQNPPTSAPAPDSSTATSEVTAPAASAAPAEGTEEGSNGVLIAVIVAIALAVAAGVALVIVRSRRSPVTTSAAPAEWAEPPPVLHPPSVPVESPEPAAQPPLAPSDVAPFTVPAPAPPAATKDHDAADAADAALRHLSARMASLPAGLPLDGLVRREATASCAVDRTAVALWQVLRARARGHKIQGTESDAHKEVALVESTAMASLSAAASLSSAGLDDDVMARAARALGSPIPLHAMSWPEIDGIAEPSRRAALVHDAVYRAGHGSPNRGILARLAMGLSIVDSGLAAGIVVDSSAHVLAHRPVYLELLAAPDRSRLEGLMLEALAVRSQQTMVVVDRLVELRDQFRMVVERDGVPQGGALVDWVVANPIFGSTFVAETLHIDAASATELLAWLDQSGIVRRIEVNGVGEAYRVAPDVLEVLDENLQVSLHGDPGS